MVVYQKIQNNPDERRDILHDSIQMDDLFSEAQIDEIIKYCDSNKKQVGQVSAEGTRKTWERIGPNDPPYEYAREVSDVAEYPQTTFSTNTLHFLLVYMVCLRSILTFQV